MSVAAIILAAGQGKRIGQPKVFLKTGDRTFLETVVSTLENAGVTDILAVIRDEHKQRAAGLAGSHNICVNPHPENGPLSSLRSGIDALPGFDGYLVYPVDHPAVAAATITALLAAFEKEPSRVVKPAFNGRAGHPVIIPASLAGRITPTDAEGGLARLIACSGTAVTTVEVNDGAVLKNINTMDDLSNG